MDQETLDRIEECAAAGMSVTDTCTICEITETEYADSDEARKRYRLGKLRTELAVRQSVVKLAQNGDARMVKLYFDLTHVDSQGLSDEELEEVIRLAEKS